MLEKQKLKSYFFQLLELFPIKLGDAIYHYAQRKFESSDLSFKFNSTNQTYSSFERLFKEAGISLRGKKILEIGSGWFPLIPYFLLFKGGAKGIDTYDVNRHFNKNRIKDLNLFCSEKFGVQIIGIPEKYNLPKEITYYPDTNIIENPIRETDLIYSRFVLEHVTPEDLEALHRKFIEEMPSGSYIIHFISPSDHRAYDDASLSLQDFLRFSRDEWDKIQTRFDYHNRWRLPHYLELFKTIGLELVCVDFDVPKKGTSQYLKFKNLDIHSDYLKYSEEELMAGNIQVILKVP